MTTKRAKELRAARLRFVGDPLTPPASLLAKVGSVLAHVEEGTGPDGHHYDLAAIRALLADHEVQHWMQGMRALALLPLSRRRPDR